MLQVAVTERLKLTALPCRDDALGAIGAAPEIDMSRLKAARRDVALADLDGLADRETSVERLSVNERIAILIRDDERVVAPGHQTSMSSPSAVFRRMAFSFVARMNVRFCAFVTIQCP